MTTASKTDKQLKENCESISNELDKLVDAYYEGTEEAMEEWGQYTESILDINYLMNSDRTLKAVKLLVAFGGPNIWVDTETQQVEGYWYSDRASAPLSTRVVDFLDEYFAEIFAC